MKIESKINRNKDYGQRRNAEDIKFIVVQSIDNGPTPHYHVTKDKVIQIIPDKCMSDSVNGARHGRLGVYHGICTKYNSLSVGISADDELCMHLILTLMQRYDIPLENVLRKTDVTGEMNPKEWFDKDKWTEVLKKMESI